MIEQKIKEIKDFCIKNSDPAIVAKYSKYFKEGYDGYGVDDKILVSQRDSWLEEWKDELTISDYLDIGDKLVASGKFEEIAFAIHFISFQKQHFSPEVFNRIGNWFEMGIANWGSTDVLCMLVLSDFIKDEIIETNKLKEWTKSPSKWKRRAVPVTLAQIVKSGYNPKSILPVIEPLMHEESEDVQKGLGTLLRELWKKHQDETEEFLLKWKDDCGRLIIRYATEKMDKENKKRFKKSK
jgi:3-methyladenine DNA glycosylase AlkD